MYFFVNFLFHVLFVFALSLLELVGVASNSEFFTLDRLLALLCLSALFLLSLFLTVAHSSVSERTSKRMMERTNVRDMLYSNPIHWILCIRSHRLSLSLSLCLSTRFSAPKTINSSECKWIRFNETTYDNIMTEMCTNRTKYHLDSFVMRTKDCSAINIVACVRAEAEPKRIRNPWKFEPWHSILYSPVRNKIHGKRYL